MEKYGVFISHRHADWALAGRIFDYLEARGFQPFLDAYSMRQGDFHQALDKMVTQAPYFLCILTKHTLVNLNTEDWIFKEIKAALKSKRKILLLAEEDFLFPDTLPPEIEPLRRQHRYEIDRLNFWDVMERICKTDLQNERLAKVYDWQKRISANQNVFLSSRSEIEQHYASLEDRFGSELVRCIRSGKEYSGKNRIKSIRMSCYAANIIFTSEKNMVDHLAFDRGMMFNIFAQLLKDDEFSLEIITNAPGSDAAQDAIVNERLANSALEAFPEAVFLSSYCSIQQLLREDPIFREAHLSNRFHFMVTQKVLPYALFHITYKDGYEKYDHVKIDLYSEGLVSNMNRRTMLIFRESDPENYRFFVERYHYIRDVRASQQLIKEHHGKWLQEWVDLKEEMGV